MGVLVLMACLKDLEIGLDIPKPPSSASAVMEQLQVFVPLSGIIDVEVERKRQQKRINELDKYLQNVRHKLSNDSFVEKAPADFVAKERQRGAELSEQISTLKEILTDLER